jgi:hypothetical protein
VGDGLNNAERYPQGHIESQLGYFIIDDGILATNNGAWLGQDGLQPDFARCSALADARERNSTGSRAPKF